MSARVKERAIETIMDVHPFLRPGPALLGFACKWRGWIGLKPGHSLAWHRSWSQMVSMFHRMLSTWPVMPLWNSRMMFTNFCGHPGRSKTVHRAFLLTVSKAFVISTKTACISLAPLISGICLRTEAGRSLICARICSRSHTPPSEHWRTP